MLHKFQFRTKFHCTVHTNNRANYFEIFTILLLPVTKLGHIYKLGN